MEDTSVPEAHNLGSLFFPDHLISSFKSMVWLFSPHQCCSRWYHVTCFTWRVCLCEEECTEIPRNGYRDTQGWVFLGNKVVFAAFLWFADANPNHSIPTWLAGHWFPWKHDSVCPIPQFGIENIRTAKMQSAEHIRQLLNDTGLRSVKCFYSPFLLSLYRDILIR